MRFLSQLLSSRHYARPQAELQAGKIWGVVKGIDKPLARMPILF